MKNWKIYWIGLSILCLPLVLQSECGPPSKPFLESYSFLQPAIVDPNAPGASYFLDFDVLLDEYGRQARNQVEENIAEWQDRYCDVASQNMIYQLIYQTPIYDLRELLSSIRSKQSPLPLNLRSNTFAAYLKRNRCEEMAEYLIFAKRCEPFVTEVDAWELRTDNEDQMRKLINDGQEIFLTLKSHYIRLRYAYQLIRLAHYLKDYKGTLDLYDYLMPKIDNDPSILENWILGHRAGALMALGQTTEANYLFSVIFEKSHGKRESAFNSFRIRTQQEWNKVLLLCKDDKERATIYALRANAQDSKPLDDMKEIYRLAPESPHLNILLIKELKRLEKNLLGLEFNPNKRQNKQFYNIPKPGIGAYIIELQEFVRYHNMAKTQKYQALWKLAEGYLETLAGDYYQAVRSFAAAKSLTKSPVLEEQLEALSLVAQVSAYREVNEEVETNIARIKLDDETYQRFPDFKRFIADKMTWLYEESGDVGKLYLQQHNLADLKANPNLDVIDQLIGIAEKELPNRFERDMIRKEDGSTILNDLIDIKGTYLMGRGELVAALEVYKKMDSDYWEDYGVFNPFEEHLIDCINCDNQDSLTLYSKPAIVERILKYEYDALANRENGASYFYRIGLAYYNMSYFGYAWKAGDYFRSGTSIRNRRRSSEGVVPTWQYDYGNLENFSNEKALEYFDKVIQLTNNSELAASAAFMAAKCEQNRYFTYGGERSYTYFRILAERYTDTQFYLKAVEECKYFRTFLSN